MIGRYEGQSIFWRDIYNYIERTDGRKADSIDAFCVNKEKLEVLYYVEENNESYEITIPFKDIIS